MPYTWFLKGKQRIIPTTGKHRGVKLHASLNYERGQIQWTEEEQYDAETVLDFLHQILLAYPSGKIAMVLDNARIHHARLLQPFLEENHNRLELVFLPPYSPQLNLVEGLWKWLQADAINNVFYSTVAEISRNVTGFLKRVARDPKPLLCLWLEDDYLPDIL